MVLTKDEAKARMLRKMMQNLSQGSSGDPLTELAKDVLTGRKGIREAIQEVPQDESLVTKFETFQQRWDAMSESDRLAAEREAGNYLEEQRQEIVAERDTARQANATPPRHSARR
ncbi:hypothetical protein IPZ61_28290 [Streptomyces sioyaensis]|uniref:hypothetical protein n=1 Tax=Streptomyces sioyaensis TaxID=67364 RepID=UPI001F30C849|nr:hypothetical protein [Streptomyces sioyaensis]MCF3177203.1 hypothetical protein [Streptomyces sioyaensis]